MLRIAVALTSWLSHCVSSRDRDRGEVGPIGYTVMVAGIVMLAIAVVAWGESVAERFMGDLDSGE